jgi:hypothetical protein
MSDTTVIRFWATGAETDKAVHYSKLPLDKWDPKKDGIWIPKSIIEHRTKRGAEHEVKLPDWFVEKEGL